MEHKKRVLIIGLDGFTWNIGTRLAEESHMPALGGIRKKGAYGNLMSVLPFETSPAWSSFQTGCLPPKTGVFAFHSVDSEYKNIYLNSYDRIKVPSVWEIASEAGKKVVSINLPMTSPPPNINGIIIPGLTCPALSKHTVHPSEIYEQYIAKHEGYEIVNKQNQNSLEDYVQKATDTEQIRCDLALKIMKETEWDIFCVEMQSTDFFQHRNWWALDPSAAGYSEDAFKTASIFYHKIDQMIQELIDAAGKETLVCIVSDHGFTKIEAEIGINTWLSDNGYLKLQPAASKPLRETLKDTFPLVKKAAKVYSRLLQIIGLKNTKVHSGLHAETIMSHIREIIDLEKTDAFCLGGVSGLLYLNPRSKSQDAAHIIEKLLDEYGPKSHQPLIKDIQPTETVYDIDRNTQHVPDYIIMLADGIAHHIHPDGQVIIKPDHPDKQGGTHEQNGIFVFSGGGVKNCDDINASIVDIVPTLLAYMNIPIPSHLDGRALDELFETSLDCVYSDDDWTRKDKKSGNYSDQEQAAVEKQLKDLGYL